MRTRALTILVASSFVASQPRLNHAHQHLRHIGRRAAGPDQAVNTIVIYELNGHQITAADVKQGIENGTLVWTNDPDVLPTSSQDFSAKISAQYLATSATSSLAYAPTDSPDETNALQETQQQYQTGEKLNSDGTSTEPDSDDSSSYEAGTGVSKVFPDGKLSCSAFPSQYGAISVDWIGLGGWAGIQHPHQVSEAYGDIETVKGHCCEGCFCSYACPPGKQKSQWPSKQGTTGQSVGGIQCTNGKLHLTNPGLSKDLCMSGTSQVSVKVQNKMQKGTAVCRTDYPGTEDMVIPLDASPGSTTDLTCPDASAYFKWEGKTTSAQYYVNPAGTSVEEGCQWESAGSSYGNYAPVNLGVGFENGAAWLSIQQNKPTTNANLDFAIEIVGDDLAGSCKYQHGQYCSATGCNNSGCTVSVTSGTAKYVFS
ncbi:MAG: hypothetical protein M1828_004885 [Chrysothrix sp. TS-e1954]|nr:MAG: hypothetical protein M1828_004885 [Chrysothrix sp. TS-e1954]